jgi:hypothetical protein
MHNRNAERTPAHASRLRHPQSHVQSLWKKILAKPLKSRKLQCTLSDAHCTSDSDVTKVSEVICHICYLVMMTGSETLLPFQRRIASNGSQLGGTCRRRWAAWVRPVDSLQCVLRTDQDVAAITAELIFLAGTTHDVQHQRFLAKATVTFSCTRPHTQ